MGNNDANEISRHDFLIIGAGPAGLQLGYFLEKAGRSYLILEAGDSAATFFKTFPRHRKLISINKVHTGFDDPELNMRWDWNSLLEDDGGRPFKDYSTSYFPPADAIVEYFTDYAARHGLKIRYGCRVVNISKHDEFRVTDADGNVYAAPRLVVATGFSKPYLPPIPGIELVEPYTEVSTDPEDFKNQRVLIIGKGNSGFETADNLVETAAVIHIASPTPINMAWKTHFVGHLRACNNNFLDTYQLKLQNAVLDASVQKIERRGDKYVVSVSYTHAGGECEELTYDRVIACTGWRLDTSIFDESCRPRLVYNDRLPEQTHEWESVNVGDLYFAGTLMQMRDFKRTTSGFIHGFRYNIRALHKIFEAKYYGEEWPSRQLSPTVDAVVEAVVRRVNTSSALFQQFGFLCDVVVVSGDGAYRYYEEVPADYLRASELGRHDHYYTVTLEYGHTDSDPFNVTRQPDPAKAASSVFLHPIVRRYDGPRLVAEHHFLEDLSSEWSKEQVHVQPFRDFLRAQLGGSGAPPPPPPGPAAGTGAAG